MKHEYSLFKGFSVLQGSYRFKSFIACLIFLLLWEWELSRPEERSSNGSRVQLKSPATITVPGSEAINKKRFKKKCRIILIWGINIDQINNFTHISSLHYQISTSLVCNVLIYLEGYGLMDQHHNSPWVRRKTWSQDLTWPSSLYLLELLSKWVSWRNTIEDSSCLILVITCLSLNFNHPPYIPRRKFKLLDLWDFASI